MNKGYVDVVRLLIQLGAHVNLQDIEGDTALHDSISKNNEVIANLLLDANADVSICNNCGFNSIHHGTLRGSLKYLIVLT